MRRKINFFTYIQIFIVLLAIMSLSKESNQKVKGVTIAALAPAWEQIHTIKNFFSHLHEVKIIGEDGSESYAKDEIQKLKLENMLLKNEVCYLKEILQNETLIENLYQNDDSKSSAYLNHLRKDDFRLLLSLQLHSIPGRVIYRSPTSWTNALWINVGEANNKTLGREIISKNSPVVIGTSVVGVIDYVGNKQSRVRLITDPGLTPSVRVMRTEKDKTSFLAKGELRGSLKAQWRGLSSTLKGIGFNYDNADEEGPPRDLRTGEAALSSEKHPKMPIIQNGDFLITTGMDGVFPRGLYVAKVSHINLLKEGDYYYEIEAKSSIENLDDLTTLFVLPSSGYNIK